jgi:hypothetical protein
MPLAWFCRRPGTNACRVFSLRSRPGGIAHQTSPAAVPGRRQNRSKEVQSPLAFCWASWCVCQRREEPPSQVESAAVVPPHAATPAALVRIFSECGRTPRSGPPKIDLHSLFGAILPMWQILHFSRKGQWPLALARLSSAVRLLPILVLLVRNRPRPMPPAGVGQPRRRPPAFALAPPSAWRPRRRVFSARRRAALPPRSLSCA